MVAKCGPKPHRGVTSEKYDRSEMITAAKARKRNRLQLAAYESHRYRMFISEDPIGLAGGINPYVYAGNDPNNSSDALGLQREVRRCIRGHYTNTDEITTITVNWVCDEWTQDFANPFSRNFGDRNARGGMGNVSEAQVGALLGRAAALVGRYGPRAIALSAVPYRAYQFFQRNPIPSTWVGRLADNRWGLVWQRGGAVSNADMIRLGLPDAQNPLGYIRFYNAFGQPLNVLGRTGTALETHIPLNYKGPVIGWPR